MAGYRLQPSDRQERCCNDAPAVLALPLALHIPNNLIPCYNVQRQLFEPVALSTNLGEFQHPPYVQNGVGSTFTPCINTALSVAAILLLLLRSILLCYFHTYTRLYIDLESLYYVRFH